MGRMHRDGGEIDLVVSLAYKASDLDLARWKAWFEHASELLFEASSECMRLRTVSLANAGAATQDADLILVNKGTMDAGAYRRGRGARGFFMSIHEVRLKWPLTLVHELGHYGFGLGDEYVTTGLPDDGCLLDVGANAGCVMERVHPQKWPACDPSPTRVLTFPEGSSVPKVEPGLPRHFCSPADHTKNNEQERDNGQSCWGMISQAIAPGASRPPQIPYTPPTVARLGAWQRFAFVLGECGGGAKKIAATFDAAVDLWVKILDQQGHRLAVVRGCEEESDLLLHDEGAPPQEGGWHKKLVDWRERWRDEDTAHPSVDPFLENALERGLDALDRLLPKECAPPSSSAVVIFSDGEVRDRKKFDELVRRCRRCRIQVHTFSSSRLSSIQAMTLGYLSFETLGRFYRTIVPHGGDLATSLFERLVHAMSELVEDVGLIKHWTDGFQYLPWNSPVEPLPPDGKLVLGATRGTSEFCVPFQEDSERALFIVSSEAPDALTVEFEDPKGVTHTTQHDRGPGHILLNIEHPLRGTWRVRVRTCDDADVMFGLSAFSDNPNVATAVRGANGVQQVGRSIPIETLQLLPYFSNVPREALDKRWAPKYGPVLEIIGPEESPSLPRLNWHQIVKREEEDVPPQLDVVDWWYQDRWSLPAAGSWPVDINFEFSFVEPGDGPVRTQVLQVHVV